MSKVRITWKKSAIGYPKEQGRTIRALGFHALNQTVVKDDSAVIRGMIGKVRHLVQAEKVVEE